MVLEQDPASDDASRVGHNGWRQGSVAGRAYAEAARREQAEHCLAELWNLLTDSPGIEVHEMSGVVSEEEISIHELRALKRWDFDWLSSPGPLE